MPFRWPLSARFRSLHRRGIIIKDPVVLEKIETCRTAIFDKTGTLTYGAPKLTETIAAPGHTSDEVLRLAASVERYSKHPLASAIVEAAQNQTIVPHEATEISERPGEGLRGTVNGVRVRITSRKSAPRAATGNCPASYPKSAEVWSVPCCSTTASRVSCGFGTSRGSEGLSFVNHLSPKHRFARVLLVSGDRESEVRYLANRVGIQTCSFGQSPEQKLELVRHRDEASQHAVPGRRHQRLARPSRAATVGLAFGSKSDVTAEAAGAVILDTSLEKVDEFFHIGRRMRTIALQSAIGGHGSRAQSA